jgi:hypothetical protein
MSRKGEPRGFHKKEPKELTRCMESGHQEYARIMVH